MPARSLIRAGHSAKNDAPDSAKQYVALSGAFVDGDAIARASQEAPAKPLLAAIILERFNFEKGETRGAWYSAARLKASGKTAFFRETTGRMV